MHYCYGSSGRAAVSFFQFAFAFGGRFRLFSQSVPGSFVFVGMCAFGIIIGNSASSKSWPILHLTLLKGDTIPHVIRSVFPHIQTTPVLSIFGNRQFVISLCTICVSYPLSLYRDIHKLSRASGLALLGMIIIVSSVLIRAPQSPTELKGDPELRLTIVQPGVFQAIGVISFAFVCHHNSLLIYGSMKTPTIDRFALVTHIATVFSLLSCSILAISAFWVFTNKTQGNILNNFPAVSSLVSAEMQRES